MTIFLILILIILIPLAPVHASVIGAVIEDDEIIDEVTISARMTLFEAICAKIMFPTKVKISLPF